MMHDAHRSPPEARAIPELRGGDDDDEEERTIEGGRRREGSGFDPRYN